ncbi:phosphohistidine phosphatase SixA [Alkalilimnicola ehrlichii MLHE-1]|uniref:Phosphohistidine phosphatase, SixA n=1 Tax=Alkalilimnicola ehrlichii (strain ATCC BAA-1101 / DSM 17681 / MLHE-1) TaxID=187272 RepID=Q0A7H1_ALKEH|nr:phosphohistidine phosphatase SixA [Alkalilimnicola ehrlichii]ABI57216.1 phosphohistidine phosphatase, SixA [Alkalilimnicola ehrlichii MLHE-1]
MWELVLVRHAIAEDPPPDGCLPDAERALTDKGRDRMKAAARGVTRLLPEIDLLLHSPLLRARQTADILAEEGPPPVERELHEGLAPGGDPDAFLAWLVDHPGRVMAVGHEPDLGALAAYALSGQTRSFMHFKKGGMLSLVFDQPPRPGGGELQWYLPARPLRQLAKAGR